MLKFADVSKSFNGKAVVDRVNLQLDAGCTHVLIGQSGCGKSTLLRLLIGLIRPDAGDVFVDGRALSELDILPLRKRFGYVIQEGGLFPHLTARDNVTLAANYAGWRDERIEQRIEQLTELTRFPTDGLDRYPAQLSGGQRQRVSLMRALMLDPDILLLDEPLAALDPMIRSELQLQLKSIFSTLTKTVVMVTHDLYEAAIFADHVVLLDEGRVVQQGTFAELLDAPATPFVTKFTQAQRQVWTSQETPP